jgi:hypothetical protein
MQASVLSWLYEALVLGGEEMECLSPNSGRVNQVVVLRQFGGSVALMLYWLIKHQDRDAYQMLSRQNVLVQSYIICLCYGVK